MSDDIEHQVTVADGKYAVIFEKSGKLYALRYGESWRDCIGDGLILALVQEIVRLQSVNTAPTPTGPAKGAKEFYSICYQSPRPDEYAVLLVKADSHFNAERRAEEELKRWPGYSLHSVTWMDKSKIESGSPVFVGDMGAVSVEAPTSILTRIKALALELKKEKLTPEALLAVEGIEALVMAALGEGESR